VCIQLDIQLATGTVVRISYPKGDFTGIVRYCLFREIGYFVGVQFDAGCKWSRNHFKPQHLLDPRVLAKKAPHRLKTDYPEHPAP
jgi:hypothetical protein